MTRSNCKTQGRANACRDATELRVMHEIVQIICVHAGQLRFSLRAVRLQRRAVRDAQSRPLLPMQQRQVDDEYQQH